MNDEAYFLLTCTTYIKYTLHVFQCWKIVDKIAASSYVGFNELILNWSYDKCYLRIVWRHHLSFRMGAIYSLDFFPAYSTRNCIQNNMDMET